MHLISLLEWMFGLLVLIVFVNRYAFGHQATQPRHLILGNLRSQVVITISSNYSGNTGGGS